MSQTLSSWVLLPGVTRNNRRRPSWVQKQRKVFFFDQRMERCQLALEQTLSRQPDGGAALQVSGLRWEGRRHCREAHACCSQPSAGAQHLCTWPTAAILN